MDRLELIAEFGCNWKDDFTFKEMLDKCQTLGIKYVKLQLWQKRQVPSEVWGMYIEEKRAHRFMKWARDRNISLFFTPFYPNAIKLCEELGVEYYKVRFDDRNRYDLYQGIHKTGKRVFVSNPYRLDSIWANAMNSILLYCVPKYPANRFNYTGADTKRFQGISDHTPNLELYKECKEKGFEWFEKHVCLTKNCYERAWSIELKKLEGLV